MRSKSCALPDAARPKTEDPDDTDDMIAPMMMGPSHAARGNGLPWLRWETPSPPDPSTVGAGHNQYTDLIGVRFGVLTGSHDWFI